jgi:hypothetical protein
MPQGLTRWPKRGPPEGACQAAPGFAERWVVPVHHLRSGRHRPGQGIWGFRFGVLAHVPAKWNPVRRQGHAPTLESTAFSVHMGSLGDPI